MDITSFTNIVDNSNAIRRIRKLYPIGGDGSYISPPTYLNAKNKPAHVFETRRLGGQDVHCVLLDSVQSQANRLEEALSNANSSIPIPNVYVDFTECDGIGDIGKISSLEAPHRIFDAIIRDSQWNKKDFLDSEIGKAVGSATIKNALALFCYSPTTLIFGGWNSTGDRGGNGPRFQRCIASEIIGVHTPITSNRDQETVSLSKKPTSKIDPLEIEKVEIWQSKKQKHLWGNDEQSIDDAQRSKPSEVNHGNIAPNVLDLGVTIDYALQTTTITLAGLRRLSFPDEEHSTSPERDLAAWTVLGALALCAITKYDKNGYSLRSRCDLHPDKTDVDQFEIITNDGEVTKEEITHDGAIDLLQEAVKKAKEHKLPWDTESKRLVPQEKLVQLIKRSRSKTPESD